MKIFGTLLRRELGSFFLSLTGYVIIAAVTLLIGSSFMMLIHNMEAKPFLMPVTQLFFNSLMYWLIVILITPVITMRLFALEKSTGTFETLMTTQVSDAQVVAAKFIAAVIFYMVAWLPTLACLVIIQRFTNQPKLDPGMMGALYLGIFLSGSMFLAIGCLASSLTRTQMVAAMVSLAVGLSLFILAYMAQLPASSAAPANLLFYFNLFKQMEDFTRGVLDTQVVVFYVSATFLFLFLTLRVVESRRWK
ncbi:MAG TPA: ABC transporter permease subunit [Verrucomicrobiae bacterium]|jgi:ABC-2 type transport system permease protein